MFLTQSIFFDDFTLVSKIGGVEVDLPQLYQLVEESGGLGKMADRKHWARIADTMNIPKQVNLNHGLLLTLRKIAI